MMATLFTWGFWLIFAVALCALASLGMRIEAWLAKQRLRRATHRRLTEAWPPAAAPPAIAREAAAARKLRRARS